MPYPPITLLPTVPNRNNPGAFSATADAFLAAFPSFRTELHGLAAYLDALSLMTTGGQFTDGNAASPSITFVSDPNTGLFSPGNNANIIGFATNGTEQARITTTGMQITGLLTGTVVTQTATDTTANRLLKVGDFGLGGAAVSYSGDVDDSTIATGLYFAEVASTGTKPGPTAGLLFVQRRSTGERVSQTWSEANRQYRRNYISAAWGAWREIYGQNSVIGTVAQTAGVPTGPLFQIGNSANGFFERRASGRAVCTRTDQTTANVNTAYGTSLFRSPDITWTFPTAFFAGTLPAVAFSADNADVIGFRVSALSATAVTFQLVGAVTIATTTTIRASAIGRWSDMA